MQLTGVGTGPGTFFNFAGVFHQVTATRSVNWLVILFVPIAGMAFDLFGKVFSNMYYPTQTQIHIEIEAKERAKASRRATRFARRASARARQNATPVSV